MNARHLTPGARVTVHAPGWIGGPRTPLHGQTGTLIEHTGGSAFVQLDRQPRPLTLPTACLRRLPWAHRHPDAANLLFWWITGSLFLQVVRPAVDASSHADIPAIFLALFAWLMIATDRPDSRP